MSAACWRGSFGDQLAAKAGAILVFDRLGIAAHQRTVRDCFHVCRDRPRNRNCGDRASSLRHVVEHGGRNPPNRSGDPPSLRPQPRARSSRTPRRRRPGAHRSGLAGQAPRPARSSARHAIRPAPAAPLRCSRRRGCSRYSCAACIHEQRSLAGRNEVGRDFAREARRLHAAVSAWANVRDMSLGAGNVTLANIRRASAQGRAAAEARGRRGLHRARRAAARRASSRHGQYEDPASVRPQVRADRLLDHIPWKDLRIHRRVKHPVIQKARGAIAFAVHRDEARHALARVQRLDEPSRVAGDLFGAGHAGHSAP